MSQTVDNRIVEMRFDNKQFEAGAKQTMGTLGKLKEALKLPETGKALEGLDKASKSIKLDGISAGIEALERRFSTLGIVGMRVIENITDGLMNKVSAAVNFVSDVIVSGGIKRAMNIENAHFQLQALLKDEARVQAVMADAMESVDGTAYAYDEAAKAAAQFSTSGIQAGDDMLGALKGITGVAAMTNSSFEDISRIFTTVAGNGRLMGDQLLQLSGRGLNAASTLADYFREVRGEAGMTEAAIREMVSGGKISFKDFSDAMTWAFGDSAKRANETFTGAMSNMKSALARIGAGFISPLVEQNGEIVKLFNALRIKINDVKSALVFDEQRSAIAGLADTTKMSKTELEEMFKTIKTNGKVTTADLDILTKKGANATTALTKYVNGVTDGSIRASYAITSALGDLTNGMKVSTADIRRFVEEGKIDLATFTSAMETEFGNEKTLSKQFTDWFLDHVHGIVDAINAADMTKPMEIFYYWVESVKNVIKGLLSVITPVGKAFADVFFSFNADDVISFSDAVERLTAKLKLSENGSKNLHDAFQGLFSVVKLVVDIFFKLLGAILPINRPIVEMGGGFLGLAGAMGRTLTSFTEMIRSCTLLKRAFGVLQSGFSMGMDGLSKLIKIGKDFISALSGMEGTTKLINAVVGSFEKLGTKATPYIEDFINETENLFKSIFNLEDINLNDVLNTISKAFSDLALEIEHFSLQTIEDAFDTLRQKVQALFDLAMSNGGIATFVTDFKRFGEQLKDAFTLDNLLDRLEKVMDVFGKFFNWVKDTMAPAFKDFNIGSVAAAGGGFGIIYAMIKAAKAFEEMSNSITAIPNLLNDVKGTLVAYQKELKADALIKTAGAIAILAGALVLLSFADTDRLMGAAVALSMIAGTLMLGISKLLDAANKGKELNTALTIFSKGLSSTMNKFGRAMEIKALGGAVKKFAESIAIIAISIIALGIMYNKDKDALMAGVELVKQIGIALVGIMAGMSILGNLLKGGGMANFSKAAIGILSLSASLTLCINALSKLFKMEFPPDWKFKISVMAGMLGGLAILAIALGVASRIAGKNKMSSGMILSTAVLLMTTVIALDKLFKMEFPPDWEEKVTILGLIFASFGALMLTMGAAARLAGGSIKAAGTILSMCVFLAVVVAALMVLTLIPTEKLIYGASALGIVLTTLGIALYGAGKITTKDTYKSVLAMAVAVGTITAALAVLSMVPFSKLLKGAIFLGSILVILAENFKQVSKITNGEAWLNIAAMIAAVLGITYSLYVLAEQPWAGLLSASVSLSAVLLSFAQTLKMISSMSGLKMEKIGLFLLATTSLIPIGAALYILSEQPWDGMLTSAVALSGVILAFSQAMKTISALRGIKLEKISLFLLGSLSLAPIGVALYALAGQPWNNMLAAGVALSGTILAFAASFAIISKIKPDLTAMATFLVASLSVGLIAFSIYELAKQPWENLLSAAGSLSLVLLAMSGAMAICSLVGGAAPAALVGIGLLDLFIANFALVLVALGSLLQSEGARVLMSGGAEILVQIGQAIGDFVGAIINGVLTGISGALPQIGTDLSDFMTNLQPFITGSKNIDAGALASVGFLAGIIIALTAAEVLNGIASLFGLSLVDMAIELSSFMTELQPFIEQSKQLKEDSMRACGYLATMIITLTAAELLAGISKFLGIGGSIADFGRELSEFGPYIKKFADDVKDVHPEAVQGAAAAAEIMANMAKKLPGAGGLVQKIFGEKSLAEFGKELVKFGPAIKQFGDTVKDVKPAAVEGAAAAAEIMANLANKLPAQGGLAQKIFGERSISEFGEELVKFGPKIAQFTEQVKNVNPAAVTGAAIITTIMTDLANNLPSSDTLWDKIFGGGQVTLSEFGEELVKFGTSMSSFSASISGINVEQVNGAITSFKDLIDLATYVQGTSATDLVNFSNQLAQVGVDSVDKFVQAFSAAGPKATTVINSLLSAVVSAIIAGGASVQSSATTVGNNLCTGIQTGITSKQPSVIATETTLATTMTNTLKNALPIANFNTIGQNVVQGLINGINVKKPLALSTVGSLCATIINKFRTDLSSSTFKTFGENIVTWLIQGMDSKKSAAQDSAAQICNVIVEAFRTNLSESKFREIGANAALGLKNGIESKIDEIGQAAVKAAQKAVNSAKSALDEHSPSKVMAKVGEFFSLGLANGIIDQIKAIALAGTRAANEAIDPVKQAVDGITSIIDSGNFDVDPVIRPVVDLSDVQRGAKEIGALMNQTYDLSSVYDKVMDVSSSFDRARKSRADSEAATQNTGEGNKFEFIQYNYSPKALTRSEIYRQTNNQFSAFRKAVNTT